MTPANPPLKRIVLILGGKGGTGKTLHCRLLYYFLVLSKVNCLAYDADTENPEFCEYHIKSPNPVQPLDFLDKSKAKQLFTHLAEKTPNVILLDMPGASGDLMRQQIETFGLFTIAKQLGYRVTLSTVLNNAYNSITSLQSMLDFCGDRADYIAVKSLFWKTEGMNFSRWENSETRRMFQSLHGIEIEMPILELTTFDAMQEEALSFFEKDQLTFGDRLLVDSFLNRSVPQLQLASSYLGFPSPVALLPVNLSKVAPVNPVASTAAKAKTGRATSKKVTTVASESVEGIKPSEAQP